MNLSEIGRAVDLILAFFGFDFEKTSIDNLAHRQNAIDTCAVVKAVACCYIGARAHDDPAAHEAAGTIGDDVIAGSKRQNLRPQYGHNLIEPRDASCTVGSFDRLLQKKPSVQIARADHSERAL